MVNDATAPGEILQEVHDSIGRVTISNPARRNALSTPMLRDLGETLRSLDDAGVRAIVIRGAGERAFAAGADITEFAAHADDTVRQHFDRTVAELFDTLDHLRTPLIAMIHGACIGAGMAIALGADLRFAASGSRFGIPAARLGQGYPVPMTQSLLHAVGPGHAAELLFTSDHIDAERALAIGLVNRVLPAGELAGHVDDVAATIAANAPLSVAAAKLALRAGGEVERTRRAAALVRLCNQSADVHEGQAAFMERRPPEFTGR